MELAFYKICHILILTRLGEGNSLFLRQGIQLDASEIWKTYIPHTNTVYMIRF